MKNYKIAVLAGDGIGPETMNEAIKVLKVVESRNDVQFDLIDAPFGANAYFESGHPFPEQTQKICAEVDAILKGPVGLNHEQSEKIPVDLRPERGAILPLRKWLNTYTNIRPVSLPKGLSHFSPLKPEIVGDGIDIVIIRELVGGLYFGDKEVGVNDKGLRYVEESLLYDENQIERILRFAFKLCMKRKKCLHNIHKSNVLKSSVLWNEIVDEVSKDYSEVEIKHMLVDSAATLLCLNPTQFDVMVMENMFGDILSDLGGGILGSLGLMPSACLGDSSAYYEPTHGSAPDIADKNIANPYSMIGSVAMMLEYSLDMPEESKHVWNAMQAVYTNGFSTPDLSKPGRGVTIIKTDEFGDKVVKELQDLKSSR